VKILVTFALENEFAPWRAMHDFREGAWGAANVSVAEINGAEVAVLITGAGPKAAGLAISKIVWDEDETLGYCISSGLAGALRPEYGIGQILGARSIVSEGLRSDLQNDVLESSAALISFAAECGATMVDRFYSAERVVSRAEEKRHLGKSADAVEMESYEVLLQSRAFGIPAVAIRAISDSVDEDLPLEMNQVFSDEGQVSIPRVLGQVARHPQSLPGLVKLGQQSKKAAESLAQFLDRYVARIAESAKPIEMKAAI
jgi:adenosylhomocysteine nucleosidase